MEPYEELPLLPREPVRQPLKIRPRHCQHHPFATVLMTARDPHTGTGNARDSPPYYPPSHPPSYELLFDSSTYHST
jgi:hypothetical protein